MCQKAKKVRISSQEPELIEFEVLSSQESFASQESSRGRLLPTVSNEESKSAPNLPISIDEESSQPTLNGGESSQPILVESSQGESEASTTSNDFLRGKPEDCFQGDSIQVISNQESRSEESVREESARVISSQESGQFSPFVRDSVFDISTQQLKEHSFSPIYGEYYRYGIPSIESTASQEVQICPNEDLQGESGRR